MGSAERWRPTDLAMFNRPNVSMLGFYRRGFLALLLALAACLVLRDCDFAGGGTVEGPLAEGEVEYNLSWDGDSLDSMLRVMLPSSMTAQFREPMLRLEMRGIGGMVSLISLSNTHTGESHVLISIVGMKSHYVEQNSPGGVALIFTGAKLRGLPESQCRDTAYLGRSCCVRDMAFDSLASSRFQLVYDSTIGWPGFNANTPYGEINGCVLQGQWQLFGARCGMQATRIASRRIPDSLFLVPEGEYRDVDKSTLMQLIGLESWATQQ